MNRFVKDSFKANPDSTIGGEMLLKQVILPKSEKKVSAQVWDTAGQEKYRSATKLFYKNASGAFVVFDLTNDMSFDKVEERLQEVYEQCGESCAVILVGNKRDLTNERAVPYDEACNFAESKGIPYFETSAKENINIQTIFVKLLEEIYSLETGGRPEDIDDQNGKKAQPRIREAVGTTEAIPQRHSLTNKINTPPNKGTGCC
eukprot:TRINITY_DN7053_c0_g2_i2.p1 TRINITY_DN7053_c0_g2~~TRINITY_DN7053_c0_g2_i2.p1  ORF type:complete len:203 (+),score=36.33 TRINITY_DN7053_c0_g2_i2:113-721(+)